jgi:subtilisin family serine protease
MERGWGSPATYIECFEWFLAPTDLAGENPDPAQAPHVINNSWGCPAVEGCNPDNFALMELAVNALRAAGMVVVVSAGNSGGSGCGSIDDPAAIFEGSFTIGATRNNDTIANFSSRGAITIDSSFRLKPNVSAPGVGVRSAVRNGGFASFSGTSMAGPHVAGAVALMISAAPHLAGQVDTIEAILQETALPMMTLQDCAPYMGMTIPNTAYGYGRIDVRAAVERALQVVNTDAADATEPWQVFPNPATDHVWVKTSTDTESVFTLFDATGRLLQTRTLASELERVGLTGLPAGSYTYRLVGGTQQQVGVIVVQ